MEQMLHLFRLASSACGTKTGWLPSLYDNLPHGCDANGVPVIQQVSDTLVIVGNVVRILLALSGGLAVIAILGAAIFYITSTGDPGRIKRAKDMLVNTGVGLMLILTAYAVVTFIAKGF